MTRDYALEHDDTVGRLYAYNFDLDIMHPYLLRTFAPYFAKGNALELGPFEGAFTMRLTEYFDDITCVEAASDAIEAAQRKPKLSNVRFIHSTFETAQLNRRYDNIFLTHVLEHLDDRVALLKKVNDDWLDSEGRFFVACPNAEAPSRQIAVNMGLIDSIESVTAAERAHGHRVTYTMDTLRADIEQAGLSIVHEGGVFFKSFANFQWDKLMQTDIVTDAYMDGCYALGEKYPRLCSSIYFVCKASRRQ